MSSCLGLYIESNIIKYAKLTKERDNIRIDSFGIKFYDMIDEAIKQIVSETYSYKTPISVNLSDEKYTYSNLFSLLNKNDLKKAVQTEFDYFCNENNKNMNALEYKYLLTPNLEDKDKVTSLYVYSDKSNIVGRLQNLDGYKTTALVPLPVVLSNLKQVNDKSNYVIVNIERNTSLTFVVNGEVVRVEIINTGMKEIFENIIQKENSYAKAYEICKNTTIYTTQGRNLQVEENEYIQDIMPVLYNIITKIKDIIKSTGIELQDMYITGLASAVNNIDLYFQENFPDKKCEILSPFFIKKSNLKLNIKDYIEVNSAISLALQGLGFGKKEINFKNSNVFEKISQVLMTEVGKSSKSNKQSAKSNSSSKFKDLFTLDFNKSLDVIEKNMLRLCVGILFLVILYTVFTNIIIKQIQNKDDDILSYIVDTKTKIADINTNLSLVNQRKNRYDELIEQINNNSDRTIQIFAKKNAIPNLLTKIMFDIPKEVQLIEIQNLTDKKVKIRAQSRQYEQLGYFIAKIKNETLLNGVTVTSGERKGEFVIVTIEGDLPY